MKLVSFAHSGKESWGILVDDEIRNLGALVGDEHPRLKDAIAAALLDDALLLAERAERVAVSDVTWLPVIPNPDKILCIGLNYENHRVETGREPTGHPAVFTRFADSQLGHQAPIRLPHISTMLDYEGELAVVIGKGGRYITRATAMEHVAGYACYNDATLRDWQRHTIQFTPGKNFPLTGGFGPFLVTADEIPDYRALNLQTRVNGEVVQSARLDQLIFSIPILIEYCSSFTSLSPGDVIVTGTPGGVGFKREPPLFLKKGDTVEVEISGLGTLVNGVESEL